MKIHAIAEIWPAMSSDEWLEFSADVGANGLLVPIVTWRGAVVDGKHRELACAETGVAPRYDALDETWDEWRVVLHCLSLHRRRNLTPGQRACCGALAVQMYRPAAKERQLAGTLAPAGAKGTRKRAPKAAGIAAKEAGSSERSVERAERVRHDAPEAFERVRAGSMPLKVAERIAKAPAESRQALLSQLDTGARSEASGDSWGTPPEWIDLARKVMGGIDVDPATNESAQGIVQAKRFFTADDDGLSKAWTGRVWLNPPYSQPLVGMFADKLLSEIDAGHTAQACVLINNATDTKFVQRLLHRCAAALFPAGRVSFLVPGTNMPLEGTRQGQVLLYFGPNSKRFASACAGLGWVGVTP